MDISISLLGNPNVGKTTLYNNLTKSFEHIGNWHGVTVEAKSKSFKYGGDTVTMTDLPGIYSLNVYSNEEAVSRDNVLQKKSDIIINICEVNNLARNLYLTLQLLETGAPLVLAVNMTDELKLQGKTIDYQKLGVLLGVPVVPISAKYREQTDVLLETAVNCAKKNKGKSKFNDKVFSKTEYLRILSLEKIPGGDEYEAMAELRYAYIDKIAAACVGFAGRQDKKRKDKYRWSDKTPSGGTPSGGIDKILLNKYFALPIFACVMGLVFYLTFGLVGKFLSDCVRGLINGVAGCAVFNALTSINAPAWICCLVRDGVFGGVGSIISFLPQITLLFLFLALLEDTGYLSRVAYMTDGLFGKIGLSGRSVFTMLMGFGCSATAVMTARNCDSKQMRVKTVLITPFMSCSARLPVYAMVAAAFFINQWLLIFLLYMLGIAVALLVSWVLERIPAFRCPKPDFIMEMSPYRLPTAGRVGMIIWTNMKSFLTRVATVVFGLTVIVWILSNFTFTFGYVPQNPGQSSMMQNISGLIAWIFKPLGFGNWRAATALLSGFVAKETIIAALQSIAGTNDIAAVLNNDIICAISFVVFVLLYVPCISTVGAIKKELGTKLMWISIFMQLGIAYIVSFVVYWTGRLLTCGNAGLIIGVLILAAIMLYTAVVFCKIKKKRILCKNCANRERCGPPSP